MIYLTNYFSRNYIVAIQVLQAQENRFFMFEQQPSVTEEIREFLSINENEMGELDYKEMILYCAGVAVTQAYLLLGKIKQEHPDSYREIKALAFSTETEESIIFQERERKLNNILQLVRTNKPDNLKYL